MPVPTDNCSVNVRHKGVIVVQIRCEGNAQELTDKVELIICDVKQRAYYTLQNN